MGIKVDMAIKDVLANSLKKLEEHLNSDVIFYYGAIQPSVEKPFRDFIEDLKADDIEHERLSIVLNTPGGSAETVEKMVAITRHHYDEVDFIIPDYAMSAGTIFCMSGDKIWMEYSSSLGPIDPQVFNGDNWVPALGYLDKVAELIEKSRNNELTQAEFLMLKDQDLAMLKSYEQARDLTISLLKEWLVKYKFKNWDIHQTDEEFIGQDVTHEQKQQRAEEIAKILGDNKIWHSHGRSIGLQTLRKVLKLKIEDYSRDNGLRPIIREYNDTICDYVVKSRLSAFLHSRNHF
ncbi:MAG: serine dehydrogenasease [Candidatus Thiodiazotropha sp. (ex Dulcina madagascariensis)]|nr:serine dehydrogenasease [Candidatus Thiodiazotropha sp. (ex Dulcina madagascariensis)]MCU7928357.1 serine dehydrogenasease [Candidatus Thiodiazotropha sp. (ex Dulcina madagascariensis)]